jgi:hypothetical protein
MLDGMPGNGMAVWGRDRPLPVEGVARHPSRHLLGITTGPTPNSLTLSLNAARSESRTA